MVGLVLVVVLAVLHFSGLLTAKNSAEMEIDRDIQKAENAFHTIDLEQAMKMVAFDKPRMLNPPDEVPPLLKYAPSPHTLSQMTGE
jgi:hypothetical protein